MYVSVRGTQRLYGSYSHSSSSHNTHTHTHTRHRRKTVAPTTTPHLSHRSGLSLRTMMALTVFLSCVSSAISRPIPQLTDTWYMFRSSESDLFLALSVIMTSSELLFDSYEEGYRRPDRYTPSHRTYQQCGNLLRLASAVQEALYECVQHKVKCNGCTWPAHRCR